VVQGSTVAVPQASVPMVPQVAAAMSVPMTPQLTVVPQSSSALGSDFDSMMPVLQMMMMQKMMQMMGGNQQPMSAQFQQPMVALAQQPMMAPVQDGGMAPAQNGTNATGAKDAYSILFPTQQFKDQVDGNGNGDESDYFDEDKIDMGGDCGGDEEDDNDE